MYVRWVLTIMRIATDHCNSKAIAVSIAQVSFVAMTQILDFSPVYDVIGPPNWHGGRVSVIRKLATATMKPDQFGQTCAGNGTVHLANWHWELGWQFAHLFVILFQVGQFNNIGTDVTILLWHDD